MTSHTSHNSYTLTFSQLVGTFVVDKELIGAQDPYVVFEANGKKCQTKAIKGVGASTCEWKETYTLQEFDPKSAIKEAASKVTGSHGTHAHSGTVLEVTAYNHNTLRPDGTIGSGTVDLARLGSSQLSGSGDRVTVHLTDKKGKSVGELKFLIHGGGYQGASSGTGSAAGVGTGAGVTQGTQGTRGEYDSASGRPITGVGAGTTEHVAHQAARKAATEDHDVNIQTQEGVATGHPTGAAHGAHSRGAGIQGPASGVRAVDAAPGEVVDRKFYVAKEDRPQDQALVEQFREHNPYEKTYETSVMHTGRERLVDTSIEALGTKERVVDTRHHVHGNPAEQIARALPAGATAQRPGGEGWVQGKPGPVCDSTRFAVTGDITVDKERVTDLKEHREFLKEFEVKTAVVGERAVNEAARVEQLNRERILLDEKKKVACAGHPTVDSPSSGGSAVTGSGYAANQGNREAGSGTTGTSTTGSTTAAGAGYGSGTGATTAGHTTTAAGAGHGSGTGATTAGHTTAGQDKTFLSKVKDAVPGL